MISPLAQELVGLLPRLRRFAIGLCGQVDQADDLVQAACERALERRTQWTDGSRLDSWMFKIVQNLFLDQMRAHGVRRRYADGVAAVSTGALDGNRVSESRLSLERVREGIQTLPPEQRSVLLLVCVEGLAYREVAETLSIPAGTVMSRLARARQALNVFMDDGEDGENERAHHAWTEASDAKIR